jgi:ribosome-associated heat shock protein Hsp15
MTEDKSVRIDKYLWCVRIFKTRSMATDACKKAHVLLNNQVVKPSTNVIIHDKIDVKFPPIVRSFEVINVLNNRISAKLVPEFLVETTREEEFEKIRIMRETTFQRKPGAGRPTKKERRQIDQINPFK